MKNKRICVGRFSGVHGVRGLLRLLPFCEDISLLENYSLYLSESSKETVEVAIKGKHKKYLLTCVKGIDNREEAKNISNNELWVDRVVLPEIDEDEYYIEDLKGLKAQDKKGVVIGKIIHVFDFGSAPVIEIKPDSGSSFYLPFTEDYVIDVDMLQGIMTIDPKEWLD